MSLFARKPIEDLQPVEGAHSLKRALGAGDLIMLAIGAVIGALIYAFYGYRHSQLRRTRPQS